MQPGINLMTILRIKMFNIFVDFDSTINDLDKKWVEEINRLSDSKYNEIILAISKMY